LHLLPLTFLPLPPCVNLLPPQFFFLLIPNGLSFISAKTTPRAFVSYPIIQLLELFAPLLVLALMSISLYKPDTLS
jgi:hypothetical protein